MKKIIAIPADSIDDLLKLGRTYEYFRDISNPESFFDKVYYLTPFCKNETKCGVEFMKAEPKEFKKIIERIKPDIVRVYGGGNCCDWAIANKVEGIPIVVSVHDTSLQYIHQSVRYADKIICISEAVKEIIINKFKINPEKVELLYNRIDIDTFCKKNNQEKNVELNKRFGKGVHILHVGRREEQKNLETVIRALKYLPKDFTLISIGKGDSEEYEKIARIEDVRERCYFIDNVSREELSYYYSWCDCMCTPSRWEGFGFIFVEAAACESAVITSNISPMKEFISNGENGILVDDYNNPIEVAKAIKMACQNNEMINNMKKEARNVGLRFDKNKIGKQEIGIYNKVMEDKDNQYLLNKEYLKKQMEKKIIIFGAGSNGKELLNNVNEERVAFFSDNNTELIGKEIKGKKIISFEQLKKIGKQYNIVVTPFYRKEISEMFLENNLKFMDEEFFLLLDFKISII